MELNKQDIDIIIQALENISIPVNQASRVLEIISKLKLILIKELVNPVESLTDIESPATN
jgi:hypothetical protein